MKLDIGFVGAVKEGFQGIEWNEDVIAKMKEIGDETVDEVFSRNFVVRLSDHGEYKRVEFWNELCRILKPLAQAQIVVPYWAAAGGYINPHYQEPLFEGSLYCLTKEWRTANMPDVCDLYACDFDVTWGYNLNPSLHVRNAEYQQFALGNYLNAAVEIIATVTKRKA